jgi:hypothetical protein
MADERTTKERLSALETGQEFMCKEIDEIKTNHLVHLQKGVDDVKDKLNEFKDWIVARDDKLKWWLISALFTICTLLISNLLVSYFNHG